MGRAGGSKRGEEVKKELNLEDGDSCSGLGGEDGGRCGRGMDVYICDIGREYLGYRQVSYLRGFCACVGRC